MKVYEVKKPKKAMKSYKNYSHTGDKDLTRISDKDLTGIVKKHTSDDLARIVKKFQSGKYSKTPCGK